MKIIKFIIKVIYTFFMYITFMIYGTIDFIKKIFGRRRIKMRVDKFSEKVAEF